MAVTPKPTNLELATIAANLYRGMPNGPDKLARVSAEALKLYYKCSLLNAATAAPDGQS